MSSVLWTQRRNAFGSWASLPPSKRRQYLLAAADAVEARASDIIEAIMTEMGGPAAWGKYNVKVLAEKLRFAADGSYQGLTGEVIPSENPSRTMIVIRKPVGVVISIVPWNAPALLVGASVPAALVLGNTVVIKASGGRNKSCSKSCGRRERIMNFRLLELLRSKFAAV